MLCGWLFIYVCCLRGRDFVSCCPLALGGKCTDFKSPTGFQSQMSWRYIFSVQVPSILGVWCGGSCLCASDVPLGCGQSHQGFGSQPYLHSSVSVWPSLFTYGRSVLPVFSISCPDITVKISCYVNGTRWTWDLPTVSSTWPLHFYLILFLIYIRGWQTRAQGPNPVCICFC